MSLPDRDPFASKTGERQRHLSAENSFLADSQVASYIGWVSYNALLDKNNRRHFKKPHVQQLIARNNPRRESVYGKTNDRLERYGCLISVCLRQLESSMNFG